MRNTIHQKGTAMKNPNIPQDWKKEVELYIPKDAREESEKRESLTLMEREGDRLLLRECSYAHMTASSVIVNRNRTKMLMAFHKIYQSWAWTGGHADGDGDFEAVARREAQEETGIQNLKKLGAGAASLEVLPVWAHQKHGQMVASHLHLNIYICLRRTTHCPCASRRTKTARWAGFRLRSLRNMSGKRI